MYFFIFKFSWKKNIVKKEKINKTERQMTVGLPRLNIHGVTPLLEQHLKNGEKVSLRW